MHTMEYNELQCLKVQNLRECLSMKEPNQRPSCPPQLSKAVLNESFLKPVISILSLLPSEPLLYNKIYHNFQKTAASKRLNTLSHNCILSQTFLGETWILLIKYRTPVNAVVSSWVSGTPAYSKHWLIFYRKLVGVISIFIYGKTVVLYLRLEELWRLHYHDTNTHTQEVKFPRKEGFITWINL